MKACICPIVNQIWFLTLPNSLSLLFCIFINTKSYEPSCPVSWRAPRFSGLSASSDHQSKYTFRANNKNQNIPFGKSFGSADCYERSVLPPTNLARRDGEKYLKIIIPEADNKRQKDKLREP